MEIPRPKKSPEKAGRRPTLKDVALQAGGLHPSTVSVALRNFPGVSDGLRRRIKAVAKQLGYRPDPLLAAFNSHRISHSARRNTVVIGMAAGAGSRAEWEESPMHRQIWAGARRSAGELHAKLELFIVGPSQLSAARLSGILVARGITGLIVAPSHAPGAMGLDWSLFSAVRIEEDGLTEPRYQVGVDHRLSARRAWLKVRSLGYQRVGFLDPADWAQPGRVQMHAGIEFEQARGPSHLCIPFFDNPSPSRAQVGAWLSRHRVEAVLCPSVRGLALLRESHGGAGTQCPAFACLQLTENVRGMAGMLAGYEAVGALAVEQLVTLMRTHERGAEQAEVCTLVPSQWQEGASCPPR
jgi:LacI family transcriptional regulator